MWRGFVLAGEEVHEEVIEFVMTHACIEPSMLSRISYLLPSPLIFFNRERWRSRLGEAEAPNKNIDGFSLSANPSYRLQQGNTPL